MLFRSKNKVEIRTIKENHKNELIKYNIEKEREIKNLNEEHEHNIEEMKKEWKINNSPGIFS